VKQCFTIALLALALSLTGCVRPKPGPGPDPVPPVPVPVVVGDMRVIFVYESSANNTAEQLNILNSTAIAAYLNAKCEKGPNGRPEWRRFDKDVTVSASESKTIRDLWESVKPQLGTLPQVVIVHGTKGEVFDLPATEDETLALLKKHGG
jgi:hypothetical protein